MDNKIAQDNAEKLSDLNKKILEVKKKIQLSEGQRKALFEDAEAQQKINFDEIVKLKKEISQTTVLCQQNKSQMAKYKLQVDNIDRNMGSLGNKSCDEVVNLLDLQITDKQKQTDLLKFKTKKRRKYLTDLAAKYRMFLNKQEKIDLEIKVEQPVKKVTSELQNKIHSIEVKIREALHVQNKYVDVQKSLKEDANNFESNMNKLEKELEMQREDTKKLQEVMDEATRMRNTARHNLLQEERSASAETFQKEKEATEGKRLIIDRRLELERLQKKIFQTGKILAKTEHEGTEENLEETVPTCHPVELMSRQFEVLKKTTGGTTTEEVINRLESQKETEKRLQLLREKYEEEKKKLEKKMECLLLKFEAYKFTDFRDSQHKTITIDRINTEIDSNTKNICIFGEKRIKYEMILEVLMDNLHNIHVCLHPLAVSDNDVLSTIQTIENEIKKLLEQANTQYADDKILTFESIEEKWLPGPYGGLIRRTPLPQTGPSPAPPPIPGSEDEEEVPSRNYLKRQAQLVIDAKSRRKNVRIPQIKRN